jgi:hypothetical protein
MPSVHPTTKQERIARIEIFKPAIALPLPPAQGCLHAEHSPAMTTPVVSTLAKTPYRLRLTTEVL